MLLFKMRFWEGLKSGAITLTFRAWDRARVKPGTNQRTHPIGVLHIDGVREVELRSITDEDARRAGFVDRDALVGELRAFAKQPMAPASRVFRVELHYAGENDRVAGADRTQLARDEVSAIRAKLASMDARSGHGRWTSKTLALIAKHPHVAASQLAAKVKRETLPFKADVVKLKKLGLTESFEVGYDLTPRGRAYLAAKRATRPPASG